MFPEPVRRADPAAKFLVSCILAVLLLAPPVRAVGPDQAAGGEPDELAPRSVGPVMTTATRADRDVMEIPGNATVIEREEIERSGVDTVPNLLRREAGISVVNTTGNPTFNSVEARGFNNGGTAGSNMLVLIDGRRANEADSGIAEWAFLNIDEVERIEILRGPASAVWGDNAIGGVIQIFTRPPDGKPRVTMRGSGGSYSTGRGSIRATGNHGPVFVSLFGSGYTTNGYRERSSYDSEQFNGRIEVDLGERVMLGFEGGHLSDDRRFPGALFESPEDELEILGRRAAAPRTSEDESRVDNDFIQARLEALLADDVVLRVVPWYRWRDDATTITSLEFGTTTIDFEKYSVGADVQIQVDKPLGELRNRLVAGGQFLMDRTDRDIESAFGLTRNENRRTLAAGFLQEELNLTPDLLLTAGVRFDYADYRLEVFEGGPSTTEKPDFSVWSPKAALTWQVAPAVATYFSYARGFRFPNFDEASPFFGTIPDLDTQKSDSFEFGAKARTERVQGGLALYWMNVRDELIFDPVTFENENFDRTRHRGIEFWIRGQVCEWLEAYAAYTLDDARVLDQEIVDPSGLTIGELKGDRIPITPLHRGTFGLFFRLPFFFELTYNLNVVGARRRANDFVGVASRLSSYVNQDVFVAFRPPLGEHFEGALTFAIRNIGADYYEDFGALSTVFRPPLFEAEPAESVNPLPSRNWEIGFVLTYKY